MSLLDALRESSGPTVAVEIASDRVSAASLELRAGQPVVSAHATEPLPPGALVPSLTGQNVHDRAAVAAALGRVFDRIGGRPRRVGLVVPDLIAKVSLVRFEKVPPRTQDLDQLVRWQVRKGNSLLRVSRVWRTDLASVKGPKYREPSLIVVRVK